MSVSLAPVPYAYISTIFVDNNTSSHIKQVFLEKSIVIDFSLSIFIISTRISLFQQHQNAIYGILSCIMYAQTNMSYRRLRIMHAKCTI